MNENEIYRTRLIMKLVHHVGRGRAISMAELFEHVYQRQVQKLVNDTRRIRKLVEEVRKEGTPVCSLTNCVGGGYYLASAGSELEAYCRQLRKSALKKLMVEAKLRKLGLPELLGQISLNLGGEGGRTEMQPGLEGGLAETGHRH